MAIAMTDRNTAASIALVPWCPGALVPWRPGAGRMVSEMLEPYRRSPGCHKTALRSERRKHTGSNQRRIPFAAGVGRTPLRLTWTATQTVVCLAPGNAGC